MVKEFNSDVWKRDISFYLDCKSFIHKTNPKDQARAPSSREWRKTTEGLKHNCTAKGSNMGTGGRTAHFIVAMCYGKGVLVCEQYEKMNGSYFAEFVKSNFNDMFSKSINPNSKLFIQDGDPSQNSKAARIEIAACGSTHLKIPARSPDVKPIENLFNLITMELKTTAINRNITHETYVQFCHQVITTMCNFPASKIDKIIDTMDMKLIIQNRGERLKY